MGNGNYETIAQGFGLRNVKWNWQKLYMQTVSAFTQLKTSNMPYWTLGSKAKFNLHKLPGEFLGKKYYFLTSSRWPNWVVTLLARAKLVGSHVGLFGLDLNKPSLPHEPQRLAVHVCKVNKEGYMDAVMIQREFSGTHILSKAYVHHGSWFVYGWDLGDPGKGGYWKPDVDLDVDFC